uniref:C1 n=1 Tax=Tomato yellow leaf curl Thailand betasatellite TaxID=693897 RepID=D2X8W6_9VIRU|nr:C1 protein [Tomato yellow leaf curl Thailand betasatellite]ADB43266.1 C1 protein [Tomato yellow leaf curl Thailand betasatellite]ADB43267.1 C1 protein [Tomato yellow leaf curl Thailand betasatellite]APZ75436.1 C1 [Tomato yellow leaf curl Thailand betasatellite]
MTIKYKNKKGMEFIINVRLKEDSSILVHIRLFSTGSPVLATKQFMIPYGHSGIIPPFNFNALEEGIRNMIDLMYKESTVREFKQEHLVEIIDLVIMNEAPVVDIDVMDEYDVYTNSAV